MLCPSIARENNRSSNINNSGLLGGSEAHRAGVGNKTPHKKLGSKGVTRRNECRERRWVDGVATDRPELRRQGDEDGGRDASSSYWRRLDTKRPHASRDGRSDRLGERWLTTRVAESEAMVDHWPNHSLSVFRDLGRTTSPETSFCSGAICGPLGVWPAHSRLGMVHLL